MATSSASFAFLHLQGLLMALLLNAGSVLARPEMRTAYVVPGRYITSQMHWRTTQLHLVHPSPIHQSTMLLASTSVEQSAKKSENNTVNLVNEENSTSNDSKSVFLDIVHPQESQDGQRATPDSPEYHNRSSSHPVHPHFHGTYHTHIVVMDLDIILASKRLVHNYVGCLIDVTPCTHEGDELKKILPDAVATKCAKCSARQKAGAKKVITALQARYPDQWLILNNKWQLDKLKGILY